MIDARRIRFICEDCLLNAENPEVVVKTNWGHKYIFDKNKIEKYTDEIYGFLKQLPKEFQSNDGGGWSTLNACVDKNQHEWGDQEDVDYLVALGIATENAALLGELFAEPEYQMFVVFNDEEPAEETKAPKKSVVKSLINLAGAAMFCMIVSLSIVILVPIGAAKLALQKIIKH